MIMIKYLITFQKVSLLLLVIGSALLTSSLLRSFSTSTMEGSLLTEDKDILLIFLPSRDININLELTRGVSAQLYMYNPSGSLILNITIEKDVPKRIEFIAGERGYYKLEIIANDNGTIELSYYLSISGLEYDLLTYSIGLVTFSLVILGFIHVWRIKYGHID